MPLRHCQAWLGVILGALATAADATSPTLNFTLGIYGPFTSFSQTFLAGAIAFDLDFRKNFEPELVQRFGDPIVQVPNLNSNLRMSTIIGTSDSNPEIGMRMALDWLLGNDPFPKIDGLIGGFHSAIAAPIASNAGVFSVPQVAWGATSPTLSDKVQYPFFSRTLPPDSFQGSAIWAWMIHFSIPSAAFFYGDEPYGEGLYQATLDAASADSQSFRIHGVAIAYMPDPQDYNVTLAEEALQDIKKTGSRFIVIGMGRTEAASAMYVMEQQGVLYSSTYQLLGSESVTAVNRDMLNPSRGLPVGFQKFLPVTAGNKFPEFAAMWSKMHIDDIYGAEARQRYMLNDMRVSVENASQPMLTSADFVGTDTLDPMVTFIFDAGYTFVHAVNALLSQGVPWEEVGGNTLLQQIRATNFEGISGQVSFNQQGDRVASFQLWNQQNLSGTPSMVYVGDYVSLSGAFDLISDPVWVTGEALETPPAQLLECPFGFERDTTTNVCTACRPGIGCGYIPEDGFPLGIFGPFTSLSQDLLATAVMFDLDFRKNTDPALRARFGAPLVEIPNMHPDLKIKVQLGTSDSRVNVGMETTLEWFLGIGEWYKVAGIVGGYHSSVAGPVASNAQVFEVPQVSWGATSPSLSDKTLYPWFVRTIPPDSLQGSAMWAWMNQFNIPSVAYFYTRESYGDGLFQTTSDLATSAGQPGRISGVGINVMNEDAYDVDVALEAVARIRTIGTKFVMMAIISPGQATSAMYAMELEGVLYSTWQLLGTEGVDYIDSVLYKPSRGLPVGFQKFQPVTQGPLYPRFLDMWTQMVPSDVYGADARRRYMIDHFLVLPSEADRPMLVESDFDREPWFLCPFIIDATYTFVVAINNLLNAGVPGSEIHGERLLQEVRNTSFEGVTGNVSYDGSADRVGDYELMNYVATGDVAEGRLLTTALELRVVAKWSAGTNLFTFTGADDRVTWVNGTMGATAPEELIACAPGQRWDEIAGLCLYCPVNWYSLGGVGDDARCIACLPGEVSNRPFGATGCELCTNGTFRTVSDENCTACPLGMFGASMGQSACVECGVGEYASEPGLSACSVCGEGTTSPELYTTMSTIDRDGRILYSYLLAAQSAQSCGCDVDARLDGGSNCIPCTEGMNCLGMNDVRIEEGYFAEEIEGDGELSVFKCHGDFKRCAGGYPGETCADGREGVTCAECKNEMTPATGGRCVKCAGDDKGPFIAVTVIGVLMLIITYHLIDTQNRATQSHALLLCAIAVGQLITVTQQLGVVGMLSVDWEEPIKSFMKLLGLLTFNVEVIRLNCVSSQGPVERFSMKVFIIFFTIAIMLTIHAIFVIFRHGGRFRQQLHSLVGSVGTLFMVFYISVTSTVLEPLQCQEHPNDLWTIRSYPSIICWETSDHRAMLILGCFAFVMVPVLYLAGCAYIVKQFPKRMRAGDAAFLKSFSFLFFRFRASQHSYVLIQMLRSFCCALVLVIPDSVMQVFALEVILLLGYSATLYFLPWRVVQANILDCLFGGCTLIVVCLASLFLDDDDKDLKGIAWLSLCLIALILLLVPCAVGFGIYRKFFRLTKPFQFFLCHHKNGSGAYVRLLKMHLVEHPKVKTAVFVDSDNLDNLDRLFDYVGNDTGCLAVICTEELFTRPWCVGEMVTARLKKVRVVLVQLPSAVLPDEPFIEELEDRICNMEVLTENGMSYPMIAETFHWIADQPSIHMPSKCNPLVIGTLADRLANKEEADVVEGSGMEGQRVDARTSLLYDLSNMEAAATAYILKKLLLPLMSHENDKLPEPLEGLELPDATQFICVVCTNGTFENPDTMKVLLKVPGTHASLLPLICEQAFRFPPKDMSIQLQRSLPPGFDGNDANIIGLVIAALFKEIAINFVAQHAGEANLKLAAEDVAKRLLNNKIKASTSTRMMSLGTAASISKKTFSQTTVHSVDSTKEANTIVIGGTLSDSKTTLASSLPGRTEDAPFIWDLEL